MPREPQAWPRRTRPRPVELEEAAFIDGAGHLQRYFTKGLVLGAVKG